MARFYRKLAILAKIEGTYGTDASPTGGADAMLMREVTITPMEGQEVSRDLITPYMGHQGVILAGIHTKISGKIEIAGAGAAGDVPAWGALLRACGFSETVTPSTKVDYAPVSDTFPAVTIYYNADGVNHILLGARGTVRLEFNAQQIPYFTFEMTGLKGTVADTALPTTDLTAFVTPLIVNKANTSLTLHSHAAIAESLTIDVAAQVEPRLLINHESIQVTDRMSTGQAVIEATSLATKDWFSIATARTRAALAFAHGTTAGNIVELAAPKVEIGRPTQGQTQKILNYTLPLMLVPNAGNDELVVTVK